MTDEEMISKIIEHTEYVQATGRKREAFEILQTKWYGLIIFQLCQKSPSRFGELKRALPDISNVVLTSALRKLEEKKLLTRVQFNEIPPHVEYSLTELGRAMLPIFYEMIIWEEKYMNKHF